MNHLREACEYLRCVSRVIQEACKLFSGTEEIWADQCKNIIEQFYQRPTLEHIVTEVSHSSVEFSQIDSYIIDLIPLIEDFEKHYPSNHKTTASAQDRRKKIHGKLIQCAELIHQVDRSPFEEMSFQQQKGSSPVNAEQSFSSAPSSEQNPSPPVDDTNKNHGLSSRVPAGVLASQQKLTQEPVAKQPEKSFAEDIDLTELREAIVQTFNLEDLSILCADIRQALHRDGINEYLTLDALSGSTLPVKAQSLINHCERHGWLSYLRTEIRKARSQLEL